MEYRSLWEETDDPNPERPNEGWLLFTPEDTATSSGLPTDNQEIAPTAKEESRLFDLIGKIDLKILQGECVYIQVSGVAYKVLYGVYWRSVHSGVKYWGFRCEEIERGMWAEGDIATQRVDIPICYTPNGWVVEEQSLRFLLHRDRPSIGKSFLLHSSR
jgi:hypothetical protein